jgi:hypothetical protein
MERRELLRLAVITPLGLIDSAKSESHDPIFSASDEECESCWSTMLQAIKPHVTPAQFEEYFLTVKPLLLFEHELWIDLTSAAHTYVFAHVLHNVIQKARRETHTVPITAAYSHEDGNLNAHFFVYFEDELTGLIGTL